MSESALSKPVDEARVNQVVQWLLTGNRDAHIIDAIRTTWPDQEVRPLIVAALADLSETSRAPVRVVHGWCVEATRHLYSKMLEIGDFAGALRAVKQLRELANNAPFEPDDGDAK